MPKKVLSDSTAVVRTKGIDWAREADIESRPCSIVCVAALEYMMKKFIRSDRSTADIFGFFAPVCFAYKRDAFHVSHLMLLRSGDSKYYRTNTNTQVLNDRLRPNLTYTS